MFTPLIFSCPLNAVIWVLMQFSSVRCWRCLQIMVNAANLPLGMFGDKKGVRWLSCLVPLMFLQCSLFAARGLHATFYLPVGCFGKELSGATNYGTYGVVLLRVLHAHVILEWAYCDRVLFQLLIYKQGGGATRGN